MEDGSALGCMRGTAINGTTAYPFIPAHWTIYTRCVMIPKLHKYFSYQRDGA
jgi:hypothetical protein